MVIEKKEFRNYNLDNDNKNKPMAVKLNERDEEMLSLAMYALNIHSKSGVLKRLARWGFEKVILNGLGVDDLHYLTRSDRTKVIQEKPTYKHFLEKRNTK